MTTKKERLKAKAVERHWLSKWMWEKEQRETYPSTNHWNGDERRYRDMTKIVNMSEGNIGSIILKKAERTFAHVLPFDLRTNILSFSTIICSNNAYKFHNFMQTVFVSERQRSKTLHLVFIRQTNIGVVQDFQRTSHLPGIQRTLFSQFSYLVSLYK